MIEVDVYVSALKMTYDFVLDENTTVENIIEELVEMVCQNERCLPTPAEYFELCCPQKEIICRHDATLREYCISNGDMLMLI